MSRLSAIVLGALLLVGTAATTAQANLVWPRRLWPRVLQLPVQPAADPILRVVSAGVLQLPGGAHLWL